MTVIALEAIIVAGLLAVFCSSTTRKRYKRAMSQDFLDRHYPFLEPGQEPPGRFAPSEKLGGMSTWQGRMGWRTRHGEAIVRWQTGRLGEVENALYPDGPRGWARNTLDHGFRRRAIGERLWMYGQINIRPDDVIFIDGAQPVYRPPPQDGVADLEADLARDPAFLAAIKDDRFALAVVKVFNNRGFYKGQDAPAWGCGCRHVAALVANLRGKGESYQDYYPGNTELAGTAIERQLQSRIDQISKSLTTDPPLAAPVWDLGARLGPGHHSADEVRQATQSMVPEFEKRRAAEREAYRERQRSELDKALWSLAVIRERHLNDDVFDALWAHLRRLGWRTETDEDRKRVRQEWVSRSLQVLQEVKEVEQRPAAPPGAWIEPLRNRRVKPLRLINREALERMPADVRVVSTGELYRRLWDLALTGRVTEQEYRALTERSSQSSRYGVRANRRGAVS